MEIANLADLTCDDALAAMWDYLDGELNARTAIRIDTHLWICVECERIFEVERRFLEAIARATPTPDVAALHRRVHRALVHSRSSWG